MVSDTDPETTPRDSRRSPAPAGIVAAVIAGIILVYSLLIVQQPILGALAAGLILFLHFGVRFIQQAIRAYHRRTAALESIAASLERMGDGDGGGSRAEDRDH